MLIFRKKYVCETIVRSASCIKYCLFHYELASVLDVDALRQRGRLNLAACEVVDAAVRRV